MPTLNAENLFIFFEFDIDYDIKNQLKVTVNNISLISCGLRFITF